MDLSNLPWRKSSFSSPNGGDCVEVAELDIAVHRPEHKLEATRAVRDSKDPGGPVLYFTSDGWKAFLDDLKASGLDDVKASGPDCGQRTEQSGHVERSRRVKQPRTPR